MLWAKCDSIEVGLLHHFSLQLGKREVVGCLGGKIGVPGDGDEDHNAAALYLLGTHRDSTVFFNCPNKLLMTSASLDA